MTLAIAIAALVLSVLAFLGVAVPMFALLRRLRRVRRRMAA